MISRKLYLGIGLAFVLMLSAARGSADDDVATGPPESTVTCDDDSVECVLAELNAMPVDERQDFLVEQANSEGRLVVYATNNPEIGAAWQESFSAAYPEIDIEVLRVAPGPFLERIAAEAEGGSVASVGTINLPTGDPLVEAGFFARNFTPVLDNENMNPLLRDPSGYLNVTTSTPMAHGYNTTQFEREDVPTDFEGLTNPDLRGTIGVQRTLSVQWLGALTHLLGPDETESVMEGLGSQEIEVFESNSELVNALSLGQVGLTFATTYTAITEAMSQGAPVDFVVPEILFSNASGAGILADAPHPYAAALFVDWLLTSDAAMAIVAEEGSMGVRTDVEYAADELVEQADELLILTTDILPDMADMRELWDRHAG